MHVLKRFFFFIPWSSAGVLLDSYQKSGVVRMLAETPCEGLTPEHCKSTMGCRFIEGICKAHLAWLHVMRCGSSFGTTLAHFANGSLPESLRIPSAANPEDMTTEGSEGEPNSFRYKYPADKWFKDVFRSPSDPGNHLPILDEEWDEWKGEWFGIFREPASRTLSSFHHFGKGGGNMTEFARRVRGQQASMLSSGAAGFEKVRCEFSQSDSAYACAHMVEPDVPLAIQRIDGFAFVGILEEFDMSVCLFHKMMGSNCLAVEFSKTREQAYPGGDRLKDEQLEQLRKMGDPWDEQIYEAAQRRFWSDVRKYELTPSVCSQLCPDGVSFKRKPGDPDSFLFPEGF
eukprot:TRINITY_DN8078_c0_g1_i1.p1 TRINITY_DN8078_c0_g1~~TRINITY_DN8078_c0_g1_i1.p1  ORF type:complete len:343 (+),score=35.52 TRINITY_DN8078_c0_g1_i1:56-1084(+)